MARARNGKTEHIKIEQRPVLLAWLNWLFGHKSNRNLLADIKEADEGFDGSGRSYVYYRLEARGDKAKTPLKGSHIFVFDFL